MHGGYHDPAEYLSLDDDQLVTSDGPGAPYEPPPFWTAEHVAHRTIDAFGTLLATSGRVGPRSHANGWPTMLQEFSDLIDAEAMKNAREAFAKAMARRQLTSDAVSMMDEALAWPMRYLDGQPLLADAVTLWSFCQAADISIAGMLRARVLRAKEIALVRQTEENDRRAAQLERHNAEVLRWAQAKAEERGIAGKQGAERREALNGLQAAAMIRQARYARDLAPITVHPHEAMPGKLLSRASLDRYLPQALNLIADRLHENTVRVR